MVSTTIPPPAAPPISAMLGPLPDAMLEDCTDVEPPPDDDDDDELPLSDDTGSDKQPAFPPSGLLKQRSSTGTPSALVYWPAPKFSINVVKSVPNASRCRMAVVTTSEPAATPTMLMSTSETLRSPASPVTNALLTSVELKSLSVVSPRVKEAVTTIPGGGGGDGGDGGGGEGGKLQSLSQPLVHMSR